jgi:tetratricopeptide (TPR) repeat protein
MTPSALTATVSGVVEALRAGDIAQATIRACAALDRGEIHPLFLNLRAARLEQEGQDRAALSDLVRAHELAPDDAPVSNALGLALMKADQHFEAIKAYDAAVEAEPLFAAAHFNKAWACEALGYLDSAKQCYESAVAIEPAQAEPFARLASLAARRGDFDEATTRALESLDRRPDHPMAIQALIAADIEFRRFTEAGTRIKSLLERQDLSAFDRYFAMGLLGDLREREGRYPQAYAAFSQGNDDYYRANRAHYGATARASLGWLQQYYSARPQIHRRRPNSTGSPVATHVFLVGFPRSGTTLLEQALAAHPAVETMEEKEAFVESVRAFMGTPQDHSKLATLDEEQAAAYRNSYWRRVASYGHRALGGKLFIDKLPFHTVKLPLIAALFPEAKILFALRDPRDVVLSCIRARFRINAYMIELLRLEDAAAFYSSVMELAEHYRRALPLTIYDVRHENLVADFEGECRGICTFLGIEWSETMRDFASRQRVRAVATPSAKQLSRGLSNAGIGRWRRYAEQLAPVMPVLSPWLKTFEYVDG